MRGGFSVSSSSGDGMDPTSVEIRVRYLDGVKPEEVAANVSTAARRAFEEIEVRIGPLPEIES